MKKSRLLLPLLCLLHLQSGNAQDFYNIGTIQQIEVSFSETNWDYILDTAKQGSDSYTMANWVKINGVVFDSVGVKYKGNSSYNELNSKNPLHIELDHFKQQDYFGIKDIKLSNGFHDPSTVRETYLYKVVGQYMPSPKANYAQVIINNQAVGLYTNVEPVTNTFLEKHFMSSSNTFVFADNGGCSFTFPGSDTTLYYSPYTLKSDFGYTRIAALCDTLENNISGIEKILDVDRMLWMLAFNNVTVTLDSYTGSSKHNFYMYEDDNGRFNPIVWDLNGGLGGFSQLAPGPGLTVTQLQDLPPLVHNTDSIWPLIKNVLDIPMYKRMYIAHCRTMLNENFLDSAYYYESQILQALINDTYLSDANAFYSHTEFQDNLTINIIDGPKTIPGLTFLMEDRKNYLVSTLDFLQTPPVITNVMSSNDTPALNSNVFITAEVSNSLSVFIGYRNSTTQPFTRTLMFDDGLHGDGISGDNIYGYELLMNEATIQYYIYAENNTAGIFSPERAEYEYYSLDIEKGIVINEIMSDNHSTQTDSYGQYDDWIEFYNNSTNLIDLTGYYLSDDSGNPTKWQFPDNTFIDPMDFLIVWADNDTDQIYGLHTNFKLAADGESLYLSNSSSQLIDQVQFPYLDQDITYGRYPNGTGSFTLLTPTYENINSDVISIGGTTDMATKLNVFPNPANTEIYLTLSSGEIEAYTIYDVSGQKLIQGTMYESTSVNVTDLAPGIYFIVVKTDVVKLIINH